MRRIRAICALLASVVGCQLPGTNEATTTPPPPAPIEIGPGTPVSRTLALLQAQLDTVLASGLTDEGPAHLDRAEAISDRLLESQLPFAWISAESYSLEARLRQIQAMTDRIGALWAGGQRGDAILAEVRELHASVSRLRDQLEVGGSGAPPPIEALLPALDTTRRRAAPPRQPATPPDSTGRR